MKPPQPQPVLLYKKHYSKEMTIATKVKKKQKNIRSIIVEVLIIFLEVPIFFFHFLKENKIVATKSPVKIAHLCKNDSAGRALAVDKVTNFFFFFCFFVFLFGNIL